MPRNHRKFYRIAVSYSMCGEVHVRAHSYKEALELAAGDRVKGRP